MASSYISCMRVVGAGRAAWLICSAACGLTPLDRLARRARTSAVLQRLLPRWNCRRAAAGRTWRLRGTGSACFDLRRCRRAPGPRRRSRSAPDAGAQDLADLGAGAEGVQIARAGRLRPWDRAGRRVRCSPSWSLDRRFDRGARASRPTESGSTRFGNRTVFFSGRTGRCPDSVCRPCCPLSFSLLRCLDGSPDVGSYGRFGLKASRRGARRREMFWPSRIVAFEQPGQRCFEFALDGALQRAGAEGGIVSRP